MFRYFHNLNIALEAVFANKFRSVLTALGIIFGVAAVIAMLAIGKGAQQEIMEQIKLVGVNNLIITPVIKTDKETQSQDNSGKKEEKRSLGLTLDDAECIRQIATVRSLSPEVTYESNIVKDGIRRPTKLIGVYPEYFDIFNLGVEEGSVFSDAHIKTSAPVCLIGSTVKSKFFSKEDPINKTIKCGNIWFTVIGVIENRNVTKTSTDNLGISDYNNNIYAPVNSVLLRFKDRGRINSKDLQGNEKSLSGNSKQEEKAENTNQLDKIIVQVTETEKVTTTTEIISRLLKRRHFDEVDYNIAVPEMQLKQQQKTKEIFNLVLGAIASISLIVGGIGIMNIMLASVMERTKEIGVRLALGATKKDVIFQFISEATMISLTGGIIGILLGIALSFIIPSVTKTFFNTDMTTIISPFSILISFGVSVSVGIIFGYMPAKKAAAQDPVLSLRYE